MPIIENNIESYKNFILGKRRSTWYFPNELHQSFLRSELEFLLWIGCRYDESSSQIETMANAIYRHGGYDEGKFIVVETTAKEVQ